ncbi:hypothetical protein C7445_1252 [Alicyclobacillus sacchari]|uniref:Uncharacterized protein n=1 Tax=Alicyclobacillus sacchari TaxID=392010 RepID=A0A4R8LB30_9BACL|nr:hypothetical protein C7445_1252 [Alicyclobacillus sacchari]
MSELTSLTSSGNGGKSNRTICRHGEFKEEYAFRTAFTGPVICLRSRYIIEMFHL